MGLDVDGTREMLVLRSKEARYAKSGEKKVLLIVDQVYLYILSRLFM